jgi:predicted DNA binding CopG/RHH family protein
MHDQYEQDVMESLERGEWRPVHDKQRIVEQLRRAAAETALKDHRINIRIAKRDVDALKARAMEEGMPYQTLITSILHKYVHNRLKETV